MNQAMTVENCPPYPRLGELYRALAGALDTKARDRHVDRLAREGEYDWSLLPSLRETLITDPLRTATDDNFAEGIDGFVCNVHRHYLRLVAGISLDSLNRIETLPLLTEHYFAPQGAELLLHIKEAFGGPELTELLDPERQPIAVVMDWLDKGSGCELASLAFPGSTGTDRSDRELIARWTGGTQIPDLPSIKRFAGAVSRRGGTAEKQLVPNLRRWIVIARALSWLEKDSPLQFRAVMLRHLFLGLPDIDIGRVLSLANIEASKRFSVLKMPGAMLYEDLKRTAPKAPGDQARTQDSLDAFRRLCEEHDPEGRTGFHLARLFGRWHALSGQFEDALRHYEEAAELADYRAGDEQKKILEETLVLAAIVGGEKPLLKRLKNRAIAFGLFAAPMGDDVLEDWEIDQFRQQFQRVFPNRGRFPEAQDADGGDEHLPFLAFNEETLARLEPDLRKPDRVKAVRTLDGQKRRSPKLHLFASTGRYDAVRALLEHGAPVDQLAEDGASALLCAIQRAHDRGGRRTLDLLLAHDHTKTTLDTATTRKRHTPLISAVGYGEPDVVERLLAMGATADRRGDVDDVTPLYRCLSKVGVARNPARLRQHLRQSLLPDHVQRESLRRSDSSLGGIFGDDRTLLRLLDDPRKRAIFDKLLAAMAEGRRASEPKLLRIVELLLNAGASPNAVHEYPTPGRTPLMLAAEWDAAEAFELMMRHGGNPHQQDAQGLDCRKIAIGFGSHNIIESLRNSGI